MDNNSSGYRMSGQHMMNQFQKDLTVYEVSEGDKNDAAGKDDEPESARDPYDLDERNPN